MHKKAIMLVLPLIIVLVTGTTVQAKTIDVPKEVIEISEEIGEEYNICPELIQAICYVESRYDSQAVNGNCIGIMQVSKKWHSDRMRSLGVTDLHDTKQNILTGVDYLSSLIKDGEDIEAALMYYHGEKNVEQRLENGETSQYVKNVLTISEELERKHGK